MPTNRAERLLFVAAFAACLLIGAFYLTVLIPARFRGGDMHDLIVAGQAGLRHGWVSLYYRTGWQVFRGLPPLAWVYLPLGGLSQTSAYLVWTTLMTACLIGAWWLAAPGMRAPRLLWLLALLTSFPAIYALGVGQPIPLALLMLAGAYRLLDGRRAGAGGVALGLALQLKPTLAFIAVPALLVARAYRAAIAAVAISAAFLALYLGLMGTTFFSAYAHATSSFFTAQEGYAIPNSIGPAAAYGLRALAVLGALYAAWRSGDALLALAAGVVASLLASPYVHPHDLLVLFVAGWAIHRHSGGRVAAVAFVPLMLAWTVLPSIHPSVIAGEAWLLMVLCQQASSTREPAEVGGLQMAATLRQ